MRYPTIKLTNPMIRYILCLAESERGSDMLRITDAQCNWIEKKGVELERSCGLPVYIVAQYLSQIDLRIGERMHMTQHGSVLILEPNVPHYYLCREELLHHWFHIEGDIPALLCKYGIAPNRLYKLEDPNAISAIFRQIAATYHDKGKYRSDYLRLKVEELFVTLAMQLDLQAAASETSYHTVEALKALRCRMLEHPEYEWPIAQMAAQVYLSESHFYQLYRKCFGITPNRDLIGIRIDRARTILLHGSSVCATAEKCGYTNVYHFIRQFKQLVGLTPNQFKKQ